MNGKIEKAFLRNTKKGADSKGKLKEGERKRRRNGMKMEDERERDGTREGKE